MLNLMGYKEIDQLYVGSRTLVYRAVREKDRQPAIVKVLRNPHPSFNELVHFRNQYVITRDLDSPYIVQPLALERYGNGCALVMLDLGAIALLDYWQQSDRNLTEFLHIAIQLADALHYLGQQRIIHKDIKPANILIHPETKQVKLIDFSISTLLPKEQQQLTNPNVLEGTLAYISPEQTGRMNRGVDYRTDFYSLGVTFYELLTGHLPFETSDPMELIHCHIAKMPPLLLGNGEQESRGAPVQRSRGDEGKNISPAPPLPRSPFPVPQVLADIVMKLMAKNAEDRYQSALGLKHDLEKCLKQLETTGEITGFEIGRRDICDRFCIPEKIYGREIEVQTLLAAFERVSNGNKELMLVAGFSGIGKTAVINEVHKPIVKQRGYFIKGKFDQFNRNIPFSAFVQAFRDLMLQLLGESDALLNKWQSKIIKALGENGQVIIDVIPELELIIGKQPPVPELSGIAAQNRFNLLFSSFVRVLATKQHPLVIFLDDLQWADSASLNLLKLLSNDSELGYLLLLGAYRDNEVFAGHLLMLTLNEIQKEGANLHTLTLAALSEVDINLLVADTLRCSPKLAQPLAKFVYQKTQGNPFFTTQFLQSLYEDGYITFDANALYWQFDLTQVQQLSLTADVVEFTIARLRKLPEATQEVLKLAACIGNQFDLRTLAVVCDRPVAEVSADLWQSLQEGFVLPESQTYKLFQFEKNEDKKPGFDVNISRENKTQFSNPISEQVSVSYRFLHDRIQQAAYGLIPESEKPATHLKIGQLLLNQLSEAEREEKIFDLVNQLDYGLLLITQPEEREQLAQLNLAAGTKAKAATAYSAAENYFAVGRELLPADCWQSQYPLTLALFESAAEVAYLNGQFEQMEVLIEEVLREGRSLLDRVKVYEVKLQAYTVQKQFLAAIETALAVLKLLGINFPSSPTIADIQQAYTETKSLWSDRAIAELVNLPEMTDPEKKAALRILDTIISPAYIARPQFLPLIVCEQVKLLIKNGNAANAAFSYGNYGLSLCAVAGDIESGYQFGQLAEILLSKFNAKEITAKVVVCTDAGIKHWKEPVSATIKPLLSAYQVGLETGDIIFATYCAFYGICNAYFAGNNLIELEGEIKSYSHALRELKQETVLSWLELHRQVVLNLIKPTESPGCLVGVAYNETTALPFHQQIKDHLALHLIHSHKLILNYLLDRVDLAMENATIAKTYLDGVSGIFVVPVFYFYDSLARLQWLNKSLNKWLNHRPDSQLQTQLAKVAANQEKMAKWAGHAPANHLHKFNLVEAEKYRVLGKKLAAVEMYDQAIAGAKENGFIQEEALANELAAKFYLDWGKETIAAAYMQQAYYGYARWGAKTKIDQLEKKYPQLLIAIRQQQQVEFSTWNSLKTLTQTVVASTYSQSSNTSLSDTLDFASILQISQSLSSTIELNPLLANICQIILTNSGAQNAMLLIPQDDQWHLRAMTRLTSDGRVETSIEDQALTVDTVDSLVPMRLIQYVKNTQKPVLIEGGKTEIYGILEGYLLQQQPQSVLCLPLMNQGKLVAVLYLEHPTTKGVFIPYRQTVVQFFCTQAAIALQNAQLYDQAQQALLNLQQAQLQLVQSEKMSALGNLMAGIAHEINNPTNFLKGNIQPAKEYARDLLDLISLYQAESPLPTAAIAAKISEIDLEFIREDLPNLLESMNLGVERIRSISKSLRTFSRKDEEQKTKFNIHDGIDSTLLMLRHRTKAEARRPEIQIIKHYGKLPIIKCFPGQLNQVFMNILANAIDAFDEANQGKTYAEIQANPNSITIRTYMENGQVKLEIQDNGFGMKPDTQLRIFEQGFTTKEVGKGTGLGMAIAHQIITEKHGGTIECASTLGEGSKFIITIPIGEESGNPQY